MDREFQFQPGERISHHEFGSGVVLDPARDGYLRAFFSIGERRVPVSAVRRQLSRTERILRGHVNLTQEQWQVHAYSDLHLTAD